MPKLYAVPIVLSADTPSGLTPPPIERTLSLTDEAAAPTFSVTLAQAVRALNIRPVQVQLSGDLGAGKTTLSRTILRSLGHTGCVRSPTYTLAKPYDVIGTMGTWKAHHFDLYHFAGPGEWTGAGFRDCFAEPALCLIEWPEKTQALLGTSDLYITLSVDVMHETYEGSIERAPRAARLNAYTQTGLQLLQSL